ncbi:MAG: methylmalonyl-CoA mutase [Candidatus Nanopelagicaceae bacterium]|nr:methylmalonyl-CoA mutase [Candidatus Nanopelagicaceae bacterium]
MRDITESGFPIKADYLNDEKAGVYPFTRGIYEQMYLQKPWTMRQYAGFGNAKESNERYLQLVAAGTGGLSVAFDLPTQMGYDSDAPQSLGEVGRVGVAIDSLEDMRELFDNIPLEKVSTSMTINAPAAILLLMYQIIAEERGISSEQLQGTIQNDLLKEYIARGTYIYPPKQSLRLTTDIFEYCTKELPKWNSISVSGYHMAEAGANPVQEIAFTFANAIAYLDCAKERGLSIEDVATRMSFFFVSRTTVLEEVAKFRAARQLWAQIMKERFGVTSERAMHLRFHTQTAGVQLTAQQPELNLVRVALQALAAVLGGTQSLHTNSFDEALGLPTEKAARLALRTQQVIANESDVAATVDALAGSAVIESMTTEIATSAKELIARIDQMGGAVAGIEAGFQKSEIEKSAYRISQEIESGNRVVVGVNAFVEEASTYLPLEINPEIAKEQSTKLLKLRKSRNQDEVSKALADLSAAAKGELNLLYPMKVALIANATLGEISDALRGEWGSYRATEIW